MLFQALGAAETDTAETLREFDAYLDKTASQLGDSPFAAVVSKNGEIIYERYYGGEGVLDRAVNEHSRWQVFSITKGLCFGSGSGLMRGRAPFS